MQHPDEEGVMTEFLLGRLAPAELERVADRLAEDPEFFEAMAAFEDDLIQRWHRRQLSTEERLRFAEVYLTAPARRARVESSLALLEVADAWKAREDERLWNRISLWLTTPWVVPRFGWVAVSALLVGALSVGVFVTRDATNRLRAVGQEIAALRQQMTAGRHLAVAFTLTAVGEKGSGTSQGMDRVRIPADADEIQLTVDIPGDASSERYDAEIEALDGRPVAQPGPPRIEPAATVAVATLTMAASTLLDGDYVLRLRRVVGGDTEVVVTRAFRVTHSQARAAR